MLLSSNRSIAESSGRVTLFAIITLCLLLSACSPGKSENPATTRKAPAALPVRVAPVLRMDIPVEAQAVGTAEPFARVEIRSQVTGVIDKVGFREGDQVRAGDLLFRIDPRPFASRLEEAEATLAKDRAGLDNARRQAERYLPAAEKGYVSAEQGDQAAANLAAMEAQVLADEAAVNGARLDLANCTIRSPLAGISGELLADAGNLVKAVADQPLVTINQTTPIKVSFTLPEAQLAELRQHLAAGDMAVLADLPGEKVLSGKLTFLDNQVEPATGTIRLKALFTNQERQLWPGQFVNLRLRLTTRQGAIVVPARAIQTSQNGDFVYVVSSDQSVEERPVTIDFSAGGRSVIAAGLTPGESVVTDGQLRLRPGATVKIVDEAAAAEKAAQ